VPRWLSTGAAQVAALSAAIARIGPCDIICHSQGGELGLLAAAADPERVRSVVALEPSGLPDALDPVRQRLLMVLGDHWHASPTDAARADRMRGFAAAFAAAGGDSTLWEMAERGRPGHSHMLMMDHGHDTLAADIAAWLLGDQP
jgi:pimeloyl-ACP methyl ester carboxylesterase